MTDLVARSMQIAGLEVETLNYTVHRYVWTLRLTLIRTDLLAQMGCSVVVTVSYPQKRNYFGTANDRILALER